MPLTVTIPCVDRRGKPTGEFITFRKEEREPKPEPRRLRRYRQHLAGASAFARSQEHRRPDPATAAPLTHAVWVAHEAALRATRHKVRARRRLDRALLKRAAKEAAKLAISPSHGET